MSSSMRGGRELEKINVNVNGGIILCLLDLKCRLLAREVPYLQKI